MILNFRERACPLCFSQNLTVSIKLCDAPLEDSIQVDPSRAKGLPRFPITLVTCKQCGHVFIREVVDAKESYDHYSFVSAASPGLKSIVSGVADRVWTSCSLKKGDLVVDVGSNDGTLLEYFADRGATVLGIEPSARHAQTAISRGIPTRQEYFGRASLAKTDGSIPPRVICFHNVLANLEDPIEGLSIASDYIDDSGVISVLTGYHPDQFRAKMFDWIYHEHLSYFSANDFAFMAQATGLHVTHVSRVPYKGGSLHVILKKGLADHSADFLNLLAWERWSASNTGSLIADMMEKVYSNRSKFEEHFDEDQNFIGYGCSHSTTTLALNFGLENKLVSLVDDNESRQGKFSPIAGLEISSPSSIVGAKIPVVILAWQHDFRIKNKIKNLGFSGPIISLLPEFSVQKL